MNNFKDKFDGCFFGSIVGDFLYNLRLELNQ